MDESPERKLEKLRKKVRSLNSAVIAYSGGVDSTLLLRICREELGKNAVAVTVLPPDYPEEELVVARRIARIIGVLHIVERLEEGGIVSRDSKAHDRLRKVARKMEMDNVLNGSHRDDSANHSQSLAAARKSGLQSPLLDSGLTKSEIRLLAKMLGLPNWNKTSSSRPRKIMDRGKDERLGKAQGIVEKLGAKKAMVLAEGSRLYVSAGRREVVGLARHLLALKRRMKPLGFTEVVLSLAS
ncbi:hypothetical protein GF318_01265 [Candidatus Micrarchaeota archaeon]|nr:hypothetical protein [Candidatus Micrarchaeota archaeon]